MEATLTNSASDSLPNPEAPRLPRKPPLREKLAFLGLKSAFTLGSFLAPDRTAREALRYFMTPTRIPAPGWEKELRATARRTVLRSGLVSYAWGEGPRVLLVHGWDGRGTQMGKLASAFVAAGFEAVVVDLPGHGESPGDLTHIPLVKDALLGVDAEIGPFKAVVAHSFGAGASLYALFHGLRAERIVYLAGPARFTDLFDRYCAFVGVHGRARELFYEKVERLVGMDPAENYPLVWAKKVDQPALIVHDRDDEDAPFAEGDEMRRTWKGARFLPTANLGHRRILKSKDVIAAAVDFVSSE
ncbi:MAG: alpha/beta hydrolase [Bdellovibrionales bacterium]|nr:alpha/beta hydrolase [Bdellovibrionales bacterium]